MKRTTAIAAAALLCIGVSGCTGSSAAHRPATTSPAPHTATAPRGTTTSPLGTKLANCSSQYPAPDPNRPRMTLTYVLSADHRTAVGTETVVFHPDRQITELVFRLTANSPKAVAAGNHIVVTSASADHGAGRFRFTASGAGRGSQGGLLHIPFGRPVAAGTTITAHLAYTLTLGQPGDRYGRSGPYAFFGSGQPLLAWQRGYGWHTENLTGLDAESATSEAMDVDLTVHAPAADVVIASGDPATPPTHGDAMRTWHSHIPTARDVSVAAGPFAVADGVVQGVHVRIGMGVGKNPGTRAAGATKELAVYRTAITRLSAQFGPFPFASLSVAMPNDSGGGDEYPSSILAFNGELSLATHETAHQWFYALVGDDQATHPYLDEAFAVYAEGLVDHDYTSDESSQLDDDQTPVDEPVSYYDSSGDYLQTTYIKGSAALFAARKAAGAAQWDAALRCYVVANAWRIATPADLKRALSGVPAAVDQLTAAGAFP